MAESWWSGFWILKKPGGSFKCLRMSYPPHQNRSGKVWGTCSLAREAWWSGPSRREVMTKGTFWGEGNSGHLCPPLGWIRSRQGSSCEPSFEALKSEMTHTKDPVSTWQSRDWKPDRLDHHSLWHSSLCPSHAVKSDSPTDARVMS